MAWTPALVLDDEDTNTRGYLAIDDRVRKVRRWEAPSPAGSGRAEPGVRKEKLGDTLELREEAGGERWRALTLVEGSRVE